LTDEDNEDDVNEEEAGVVDIGGREILTAAEGEFEFDSGLRALPLFREEELGISNS
jgi:hypothetical protein